MTDYETIYDEVETASRRKNEGFEAARSAAVAAVAATAKAVAERETVSCWASYFEGIDSRVGPPELTPALVIGLLRGPRPFWIPKENQ